LNPQPDQKSVTSLPALSFESDAVTGVSKGL
jgi:hypothetical protein